jgi:hypothetical protein
MWKDEGESVSSWCREFHLHFVVIGPEFFSTPPIPVTSLGTIEQLPLPPIGWKKERN